MTVETSVVSSSIKLPSEPKVLTPLDPVGDGSQIEPAILRTVAYADVFDYPLTPQEIYTRLIGVKSSLEQVECALHEGSWLEKFLSHREGYYSLRGREATVETRKRREDAAARLFPEALRYGIRIASLPFVRMVALTGALAVQNVEPGADLDYLIVTKAGRVWLCRAMVIGLVHLAARRGIKICPNYFLSEHSLALSNANLYAAHEMVQMIPLAGFETYRRMRSLNPWVAGFLPNAVQPSRSYPTDGMDRLDGKMKGLMEKIISTPPADRLERWEMERKIHKFNLRSRQNPQAAAGEVDFCPDWCKGHFDGHEQRVQVEYTRRLERFEG